MAQAAKKEETEQPKNREKMLNGYVSEYAKSLEEMEREMEPYKEHQNDILSSAKDSGFKKAAIKRAAKFKIANEKKRKAIIEENEATEEALLSVQLSMF